jgi:hypothetical protein
LEETKIRKSYKLIVITLFVFLAFSFCLTSEHTVFAQSDQATLKLQTANNAIDGAFTAVQAAEKAGANVTGLLGQLDVAGGVLAQAKNSYQGGDLNAAAVEADRVLPIAQAVTISAQEAKQAALVSGTNAFWLTIAFTLIGASVFVLVLFLVWRRYKRGYMKKLFDSKPELTENAV